MADKVQVRKLKDFIHFEELIRIQRTVWKHKDVDLTPVHQFCISSRMGAILLGAFVDGTMAGFVYSFPAIHEGKICQHSHLLAVLPEYQGCGIGKKLKWAQRREALKQGCDLITWTFDPMQARNANLNFHTLGVRSRTYHHNFYGDISTLCLGPGIPTDRLLVEWKIKNIAGTIGEKDSKIRKITEKGPTALALEMNVRSGNSFVPPVHLRLGLKDRVVLAEIPSDLKSLSKRPDLIAAWQAGLRRVMQTYFRRGYEAVDFIFGERCFYVLRK